MKRTRLTREEILAIGNVYLSEGEGEGGQGGESGGTGQPNEGKPNDNGNDDGAGSDGESDEFDKLSPEELAKKAKRLREERDRHYRQKQDAIRERDELKTAQQAAEEEARRKNQSEVDNLKDDVQKRDKTISDLQGTIKRLTVERAFMSTPGIEWHNPERALTLVDLSGVEVDDDGKIKDSKAVAKAAKDLAESDAYLVKSTGTSPTGRPSGQPPAGKPTGKGKSEAEIRKKYNIPT
jgi:hypothetical protein